MVGGAIGTVATWPLAGILIETIGWEWGFYVTAMLTAVMALVWYLITYDTPAEHPRISDKEREYIENSLMGVEKVNTWPPLWEILKSVPFWSLFFLHYGNLWGLYFLLTGAPKYMSEVSLGGVVLDSELYEYEIILFVDHSDIGLQFGASWHSGEFAVFDAIHRRLWLRCGH